MTAEEAIQEGFQAMTKQKALVFTAIVQSIDKAAASIAVQDNLEIVYPNVRLRAITTDATGLVVFPKVGSVVLVSQIGEQENQLYMIGWSKVDKVAGKIDSTEWTFSEEGYSINREGENLNAVLSEFLDEVMKIVVAVGVSPNVPQLTLIKERLNKILN